MKKFSKLIALALIFTVFTQGLLISAEAKTDSKATKTKQSATIKAINSLDLFTTTISDSGPLKSVAQIKKELEPYGIYQDTPGMPTEEYKAAMEYEWKEVTSTKKQTKVTVDLTKKYSYDDLVFIMNKLSRYEGVYLYEIGKSAQGRTMYALEVDKTTTPKGQHKTTVLLTGQVHARETAGATFILKELAELLAADTDRARQVLETTRFVAVPVVNPDGHDGIAFDTKNWTYKDGQLWKANAEGTDLNRNFPGLCWFAILKDGKVTKKISNSPTKIFYPGPYGGSAPETKAMMKFYQYYVGVEQADLLIDYHQQGRITYAGKSYLTKAQNKKTEELRSALYAAQRKGAKKVSYIKVDSNEPPTYGCDGTGSTNTDYAWTVALGAKFSTSYGFSVFTDAKGKEHTLIELKCLDDDKDLVPGYDTNFSAITWEIGNGVPYLGNGAQALKNLQYEYDTYNFKEMLYTYSDFCVKK